MPERFRRVDQLVSLALERPASERAEFIRETCAGEEDLRIEVESLLATQDKKDSFLTEGPARLAAQLLAESAEDNASMQPVVYPQDIKRRWPQIFPVLAHEQIDLIRSRGSPPRRFAPGELLTTAGGLPRMFVVLEGSIDVVRNDGLGSELLIASYEAGQFSGEVNLLSGLPGIADIKAGPRGCYAIPFTPESVRAIIIAHLEIGEMLMRAFILRRVAMLSADRTGTIVLGRASDRDVRYKLVEKLGGGGMGVVYLAEDPKLGRRVAIKLMEPKTSGNQSASEGRARLFREAQALAQLSHPNVIAVHDVGTFADRVFIAMEYVEGSTLSQWLAERKRTWREVLSIFIQAGRGLAAAHAVGIVHRDFKPDNVLVGNDGRARVLDFGLARPAQPTHSEELHNTDAQALADTKTTPRPAMLGLTVTQRGKLIGTPAFMAPEQLMGERVTEKTDQYSFCVALFQGLYGALPFDADNFGALLEQIRQRRVTDVPKRSSVPSSVHRALLRGLSPNPADRFSSMEALLEKLERQKAVSRR